MGIVEANWTKACKFFSGQGIKRPERNG